MTQLHLRYDELAQSLETSRLLQRQYLNDGYARIESAGFMGASTGVLAFDQYLKLSTEHRHTRAVDFQVFRQRRRSGEPFLQLQLLRVAVPNGVRP